LLIGEDAEMPAREVHTKLLSPVILDSSIDREYPVIRMPSAGTCKEKMRLSDHGYSISQMKQGIDGISTF